MISNHDDLPPSFAGQLIPFIPPQPQHSHASRGKAPASAEASAPPALAALTSMAAVDSDPSANDKTAMRASGEIAVVSNTMCPGRRARGGRGIMPAAAEADPDMVWKLRGGAQGRELGTLQR